jgi:putative hemin transport protein
METVIENLKERYAPLKEQNIRIREAAKQLGVSEAGLVALGCGENVTRLRPEFGAILSRIETFGHVMALTRNDEVVHERKGTYLNGSFGPYASLFVGKDIDLRIFLSAWASAFAVTETTNDKPRYSLQFFAKDGLALHKIYLERDSNLEAYETLVADFRHEDQSQTQEVEMKAYEPEFEHPDEDIDLNAFRQAWLDLKDTHEFFGMLKTHKVTRTQALRMAPSAYHAQQVDNGALRKALNLAAGTGTSIMVFVGNPGIIQIHTGPVKNIVDHGPWINVLDPQFNLHLKEEAIAQSWVVRKPTTDGVVTSLELFNEKKELICTLFGERKPGIPELEAWRAIAEELYA